MWVLKGGGMKDKWIKTSDKLPDRLEGVSYSQVACLVVNDGEVKILVFNHEHLCWDGEDFDDYWCDINQVDYWMPLPELPILNKGER